MDGWLRGWEKANHFDRPYRDGRVLSLDSRHFIPGYFRNVPSGHTPKSDKPRRDLAKVAESTAAS
jgi:hypothetical protein